MSSKSNKRARAIAIRAFELSKQGYTNRQIAELILCKPEQVPGKVRAGHYASIRDERITVSEDAGNG